MHTAGGGRRHRQRSAPLPAEPRAELEDVAVATSPSRRSRRWNASPTRHRVRLPKDARTSCVFGK
eukprot:1651653-Prymnesium_polylepis.1